MKRTSEWVTVGHIGVDAGLCWIGDPCYILHSESGVPSALGKNWSEFCDILQFKEQDGVSRFGYNESKNDDGLGVCVSTGYGDGYYPVQVKYKDGVVSQVRVKFV